MKKLSIYLVIILSCNCYAEFTPAYLSFNAGELSPNMKIRSDFGKYDNACNELENMLVLTQGPILRRPGLKYVSQIPGSISYDFPANYELTYISENSGVWGIPLGSGTIDSLNASGVARDIGGGLVGLPWTGHPFEVGQTIIITGTTNYDATEVLHATTSTNELVVTATYVSETFDGTEVIVQNVTTTAGTGRMAQDSSGNLYVSHNYANSTYITKINTDGTLTYDFFSPTGGWPTGGQRTGGGIKTTADFAYLYFLLYADYSLYKFDLSDGSQVWKVTAGSPFEIAVDSDDNVYVGTSAASPDLPAGYLSMSKFAAADGAETEFTVMHGSGSIWVDSDMGIVITAMHAGQYIDISTEAKYYEGNIFVKNLDNTGGAYRVLGPTTQVFGNLYSTIQIGAGGIWTYDGYIYVVTRADWGATVDTIYKLDTDLNIVKSIAFTDAQGGYPDLWGNNVIVKQKSDVSYSDIFNYYNTSLDYVTQVDGLPGNVLNTWDAAGNDIVQGNICFWPGINLDDYSGAAVSVTDADQAVRLLPFEYAKTDAYVLALGNGYMGFFREQ